ncbi:hypothetical protein [Halolamina rubra]|uniref:hypothetical protein n=1 Tax=Halolamina rubra TaxID=1380430 RepID=UPI0013787F9F|nr:hypothetical protein [Halolamina rubra]
MAGDSAAYLALESASEYAVERSNTLEVDFGQAVSGGGQNVGEDGYTTVDPAFRVRNQGTNTVEITPQWIEIAYDTDGDILRRATSENGKQSVFTATPEGTELAIGIYNKFYEGAAELDAGDSLDYYVNVATLDETPSSVSPTFEINANEV